MPGEQLLRVQRTPEKSILIPGTDAQTPLRKHDSAHTRPSRNITLASPAKPAGGPETQYGEKLSHKVVVTSPSFQISGDPLLLNIRQRSQSFTIHLATQFVGLPRTIPPKPVPTPSFPGAVTCPEPLVERVNLAGCQPKREGAGEPQAQAHWCIVPNLREKGGGGAAGSTPLPVCSGNPVLKPCVKARGDHTPPPLLIGQGQGQPLPDGPGNPRGPEILVGLAPS